MPNGGFSGGAKPKKNDKNKRGKPAAGKPSKGKK